MKKIILLVVMALATQGSSLVAKGKPDDGYEADGTKKGEISELKGTVVLHR